MLNTDSRGFLIENLSEFNKEHSPSIPSGFPRDRLPQELCKNALNIMMMCLSTKQQNLCGYENKQYYMCRRERDALIFSQIKDWELETLKANKDPKGYVAELEAERKDLAGRFEKTSASIGNKHKRWRMAADIEQLKWRIDYLRESLE